MAIVICHRCGKNFESIHHGAKYCPEPCRDEARMERMRELNTSPEAKDRRLAARQKKKDKTQYSWKNIVDYGHGNDVYRRIKSLKGDKALREISDSCKCCSFTVLKSVKLGSSKLSGKHVAELKAYFEELDINRYLAKRNLK